MKGILGNPKFEREQLVSFITEFDGHELTLHGAVYVVDAMGTCNQSEEPSYDIETLYNGKVILFKHIRESLVTKCTEL